MLQAAKEPRAEQLDPVVVRGETNDELLHEIVVQEFGGKAKVLAGHTGRGDQREHQQRHARLVDRRAGGVCDHRSDCHWLCHQTPGDQGRRQRNEKVQIEACCQLVCHQAKKEKLPSIRIHFVLIFSTLLALEHSSSLAQYRKVIALYYHTLRTTLNLV